MHRIADRAAPLVETIASASWIAAVTDEPERAARTKACSLMLVTEIGRNRVARSDRLLPRAVEPQVGVMIGQSARPVAAGKDCCFQRACADLERAARELCLIGHPPVWRQT